MLLLAASVKKIMFVGSTLFLLMTRLLLLILQITFRSHLSFLYGKLQATIIITFSVVLALLSVFVICMVQLFENIWFSIALKRNVQQLFGSWSPSYAIFCLSYFTLHRMNRDKLVNLGALIKCVVRELYWCAKWAVMP